MSRSTQAVVFGTTVAAVMLIGVVGYQVADAGTQARPGAGTRGAAAPCTDPDVGGTEEENRLDSVINDAGVSTGNQIIQRGGFAGRVDEFAGALCDARDVTAARTTVDRLGRALWGAAVARAQGPEPTGADALPANDDRPLYWARLAMARELRRWKPGFAVSPSDAAGLQRTLEYASRGITTGSFTTGAAQRKLFVSGFDPFQLDNEIRQSNPAGAAALRFDGRVLTANGVTVQVQTVVLPVRFRDFDDGMFEDAFRPHLAAGDQGADMFTTVSQGRPEQFDLEVFNGRRRTGVAPDNMNLDGGGSDADPVVPPGMGPGGEFIRSTLPLERMRAAGGGGRFRMVVNTHVREIPRGSTTPVDRADGPTEGSVAVEGGGGSYLSNESAYRGTRLAAEAGRTLPAGHLHTPVLEFGTPDSGDITDPTLAANRAAIIAAVERILLAGATA